MTTNVFYDEIDQETGLRTVGFGDENYGICKAVAPNGTVYISFWRDLESNLQLLRFNVSHNMPGVMGVGKKITDKANIDLLKYISAE